MNYATKQRGRHARTVPKSKNRAHAQPEEDSLALWVRHLGKSLLITLITGTALLLIGSLIVYFTSDPDTFIRPMAMFVAALTALIGGFAGLAIYAKAAKKPLGQVVDLAAPGAALAIAAGRLGEYFTRQGLGHYVESEALQRFPFAVPSVYEDWQLPVFVYEAAAALLVMAVCLLLARKAKTGRVAEVFFALISLCQIFLESLRADEFIRFGFVKFNMLAVALVLGAVMLISMRRSVKTQGWNRWQIIRVAIFAVAIVVVI